MHQLHDLMRPVSTEQNICLAQASSVVLQQSSDQTLE